MHSCFIMHSLFGISDWFCCTVHQALARHLYVKLWLKSWQSGSAIGEWVGTKKKKHYHMANFIVYRPAYISYRLWVYFIQLYLYTTKTWFAHDHKAFAILLWGNLMIFEAYTIRIKFFFKLAAASLKCRLAYT